MAKGLGLFGILFCLLAFVAGTNAQGYCSQEELNRLGLLAPPTNDEDQKKIEKVYDALKKVGSKSLSQTAEKDTIKVAVKVGKAFEKEGFRNISVPCVKCFAVSVQCVSRHCKAACMSDQYSTSCRSCFKENCEVAFNDCVGHKLIDPAEYRN